MRSFRRFLYTWWLQLTFKSSLDVASFIELTTSSWAWRTFIREAFSCIEYSLQPPKQIATNINLSQLAPFWQVKKEKIQNISPQETYWTSRSKHPLINTHQEKGIFHPPYFGNKLNFKQLAQHAKVLKQHKTKTKSGANINDRFHWPVPINRNQVKKDY